MQGLNRVLYNIDQRNDTTAAEKATARANIGAQGALTAGQNITISNGVISAANTEYQAGHGLTLSNNTFAVDDTVLQGKLTAGANIQINGNTISATDTTYTAGSNVQISSENVISATDTTYTAGSGLALNGTEFSNTAPNVKSDWDAAAGSDAEILNKPTIPTVNDGTLTIQKNGTAVATFSANQSSAATANITVPTDTSDLTNGAGFVTASQIPAQVNADWNSTSGASEILNKPTIPTVNDGTLTIQKNGTAVATFSANQSSAATANITVPTDTSDLTNGAGFVTASQIPAQVNADWTSSSGVSQILHKPTLAKKAYGGSNVELSSIVIDADDPDGFTDVMCDNSSWGKLVAGPYATLLNSGVTSSVGDATHGIYIDGNGEFAQGNAVGTSIETTSNPYSTSTAQSKLTIYDPGSDFGSLVKDQSSNNIGFLLPKHYGQNDLGKVPTVVNDSGYKVEWRDPTGGIPQITPMGSVTYYASGDDYINMEDNVAYFIETNAGGSFTIHLGTLSRQTIHSKIYLVGTQANCVTMTVVYEDEAGQVCQLNFVYGDSQSDTYYGLDVYARLVTIGGGGSLSFDTTMCRVYDYPCQTRDYFSSDNNNIGLVVDYIEPL